MDKKFWFDKKQKQFLKNIDTLYYSVYFEESFLSDTISEAVKSMRSWFDELASMEDPINFYDRTGGLLYYNPGRFSCYDFRMTCPDFFDMFVASKVPNDKTPPMIIQIRSVALWEKGVYACVKESLDIIECFCKYCGIHIRYVRENRCDFACHCNWLKRPEKFFRKENFVKMWVGRVGRDYKDKTKQMLNHTTVFDDDTWEDDYIAIGSRGDKCFIRIYLKTKEVVQQGYKGYFLKLWQLSGMISRYDLFCLEEGYKRKSWTYVDTARLIWALENDGLSEEDKEKCKNLIENGSYNEIRSFANKVTPEITKVYNIEFQVMYDMSKTFKLIPRNEGYAARLYDYLDNYELIYEYLTRESLRLVRTDDPDTHKDRRENIEMWDRLRSAKIVDIKHAHKDLKLLREYSSNINAEIRKKRALSALSSFGYAMNLDENGTAFRDAETLLATMNDNDMWYVDEHKKKLAMRHTDGIPSNQKRKRCVSYYLYDPETGDLY